MSYSVLQSCSNSGSASSLAATFSTANLSSGSKLIAIVSYNAPGNGNTSSIADGSGNQFVKVADSGGVAAGYGGTQIWALDTPAGDVGTKPTITATWDASSPALLIVQEVSGLLPGLSAIDGIPGGANNSGSGGVTTGSATYSSTASSEYLVSAVSAIANGGTDMTLTAPAGYTTDSHNISGTSAVIAGGIAYKNSTGGSETSNGWSVSSSGGSYEGWGLVVAAFRLSTYTGIMIEGGQVFTNDTLESSYTATVPAAVASGNFVLVYGVASGSAGTLTALTFTTTGTALSSADASLPNGQSLAGNASGWDNVMCFTAGAGDPGSTQITISVSPHTAFLAIVMAWYANTGGVDVANASNSGATTSTTYTGPTATTATSGDWGAFFATLLGSGTVTAPAALRASSGSYAAVEADTGASVGAASTTIGGGTWTGSGAHAWTSWTLGLKPAGGSANVTGVAAAVTAAGGVGTPSGSANVTGVAASVTAAGGVGTPSAGADLTGTAALVTVAGGIGTPSGGGAANVTGVAAAVTAAGGVGVPSGSANVTGVAASVTAAGGIGSPSASADITGTAALVTVAGGIGSAFKPQQGTVSVSNALAGSVSIANQLAGSVSIVNDL